MDHDIANDRLDLAGRLLIAQLFVMGAIDSPGTLSFPSAGLWLVPVGSGSAIMEPLSLVGGLVLGVGLNTRFTAFILALLSAAAALQAWPSMLDSALPWLPVTQHLMVAAGLVVLCRKGAGRFSLDAQRRSIVSRRARQGPAAQSSRSRH